MTEYPTLTGRPEIVDLANADRITMLARLTDQITATAGSAPAELVAEMVDLYREVALRQTDSGWWLNNHTKSLGPIVQRLFTANDKARLAALASQR
jgi:hypothetical protein